MFCRCTHPREFHTRIADLEAEVERLRELIGYHFFEHHDHTPEWAQWVPREERVA